MSSPGTYNTDTDHRVIIKPDVKGRVNLNKWLRQGLEYKVFVFDGAVVLEEVK